MRTLLFFLFLGGLYKVCRFSGKEIVLFRKGTCFFLFSLVFCVKNVYYNKGRIGFANPAISFCL